MTTEDSLNGYKLGDHCLPEEMLELILSYVPPKEILKLSLVCKNWNTIIKDNALWILLFKRKFKNRKAKQIPWYVYHTLFTSTFFDTNLIKNSFGSEKYKYWNVKKNHSDGFAIENPPVGSDPLPLELESTSCFATSFYICVKKQVIPLDKRIIYSKIFHEFKPEIVASEWVTGRFDCGCKYNMKLYFYNKSDLLGEYEVGEKFEQFTSPPWKKVELMINNYSPDVTSIWFEHAGMDTQFWRGHYGSKMAGANVQILFDSIGTKN